ncbi:interleukin-1 beta [Stigmatopora nigra]
MATEKRCHISPELPAGLGLEFSHHPVTMRQLVTLVVSIKRFKDGPTKTALENKLTAEGSCSINIDDIMEVKIVSRAAANQFTRTGVHQCSVIDSQKKSMVLLRDSMELHSVTLQGGNSHRKVNLNMSTYVQPFPNMEAQPVALAIKGTNLYLSCHQEGDMPTLHLEPVQDRQSLISVTPDSDMLRFLFYKRDSGVSLSTLASVQYPNWFISTAEEEHMPIEMCQRGDRRNLTFHIQRQN